MTRIALIMLAALMVAPPALAKKKTAKLMSEGFRCFQELNYGCAIKKLLEALERADAKQVELTSSDRIRAHQTMAFAYASVDRHGDARTEFARCLALDRAYTLDPTVISPKIYRDFKAARMAWLRARIVGKPRQPSLLEPHSGTPMGADSMLLHIPPQLSLGGRLSPEEPKVNQLDFMLGTSLLFGEDAEAYSVGFGVSVEYLYRLAELVDLGVTIAFSQHRYAGGETLKNGAASTLYLLQPGFTAGVALQFGELVDLSFGLTVGPGLSGLGGVSDRVGGFGSLRVGIVFLLAEEFGLGVMVTPTLTIAELDSEEVGVSFTLPIYLRLEARF